MPGKVFDLDEPNPQRALELIRQAVNSGREVDDTLILDVLTSAGAEMMQDDTVEQLILDALDAQLRAAEAEQRNSEQDDAINLLILDALTGGDGSLLLGL